MANPKDLAGITAGVDRHGNVFDYPVKLTARASILDELVSCEYGSYEDHIHHNGAREEPYNNGALHLVEIVERSTRRTIVYLETQDEVVEFFQGACTGTFGLYHLTTLIRWWKQLEPLIEDRSIVDRISIGNLGF